MKHILRNREDNSIRVLDAERFEKLGWSDHYTVVGSIDGGKVEVDAGRTCAARLNGWVELAKGCADLLAALGSTRPALWTGPAMRKNRQRALEILTGGKVKAAEAGITNLERELKKFIGCSSCGAATGDAEIFAFLEIAKIVLKPGG